MQNKNIIHSVITIVCAAGIIGCQQEDSPPSESVIIPAISQDYGVLAEGQLVPERYIDLAFGMPGRVTEILAQEGDVVTAGQPIARLDNESQLDAAFAQASANVEQAGVDLQQTELGLEEAQYRIQQSELALEETNANIQQAEHNLDQADAEIQRAEHNLAQVQLEGPQLSLERAQTVLETIRAQQTLDSLRDAARLTPAQIESEIQQAQKQLQIAEDALLVVDQPDLNYYQQQVIKAENMLQELQYSSSIVDIGLLTDAVDRAKELADDEQEFMTNVEKALPGCNNELATDNDSTTKLEFSEKLTYRSKTYEADNIYDVPNWIADELLSSYSSIVTKVTWTCDSNRKVTVDSRTSTLVDAQEDYRDAVSQYDEAVLELKKARLQNDEAIREAQMELERVERNLDWVQSEKYSREGILAAAGQSAADPALPESVSLSTQQLRTDITLAQAQLDDARKRSSKLQDGIDPDEKELAEAQLAQAKAHADYTDAQAQNIELRVKQAELALHVARVQRASASVTLDLARLQHESATVTLELAQMQQESASISVDSALALERSALASLRSARANLLHNELLAPWSGAIADLSLKMNTYLQAGQTVVTVADFSGWKVETDNLTEIEVPEVTLGQRVNITPDALPDLELTGIVTDISTLHEEKRGDVTYTVTVSLEESDPRLRWGMTMVVTFPPSD